MKFKICLSSLISIACFNASATYDFEGETLTSFTPDENFACIDPEVTATPEAISQCLTDYGTFVLRDEGKVALEFYNTDPNTPEGIFNDFGRRYEIDSSNYTPLSQFKIKVPLKSDLNLFGGEDCHNYYNFGYFTSEKYILKIKKHIENAAEFLAHYHKDSAGYRNSWFFNISQINICSKKSHDSRKFAFSKHNFYLGVPRASNLSTGDIAKGWADSNVIRRVESTLWTSIYTKIPFIGEKIRTAHVYRKADKEGVLMESIAEKWNLFLNPTNLLRSSVIIDLMSNISKLLNGEGVLSQLHSKIIETSDSEEVSTSEVMQIKTELLKVSDSGPGLDEEKVYLSNLQPENSNDASILIDAYKKFHQNLNNRYTIIEMLEAGLGESLSNTNPLFDSSASTTFKWDDRLAVTGVGATVLNDKDINVIAAIQAFIPRGALSVRRFSEEHQRLEDTARESAEKAGYILITENEGLAQELSEYDKERLSALECTESDTSNACRIKALSLGLSEDSMYYKDEEVTIIKYVPGMSYDINTDSAFTLVGATLNLIDDVNVEALIQLPELNSKMIQRYSLAKALGL